MNLFNSFSLSLIINSPYAITDKSVVHIKAKSIVALAIDRYLEEQFTDYHLRHFNPSHRYHYYADTEYEKNFGRQLTSYGIREYSADILITTYWLEDKNHIEKRYLSVEIDGQDHDSRWESSKDKGRDQHLEIIMGIKTKRIDMYDIMGMVRPRWKHKTLKRKSPPMTSKQIIEEVKPLQMLGL